MNRTLPTFASLCLAAGLLACCGGGCVSHSYSGTSYVQTDPAEVRVYHEADRIPITMHEIGTDLATADESVDTDRMIEQLIRKAASVGAHAVLIERIGTVEQRPAGSGRDPSASRTALPQQRTIRARFYRNDDGRPTYIPATTPPPPLPTQPDPFPTYPIPPTR